MPEPIEVRKIPLKHVSDASGLIQLIDDGVLDADRVVAVVGKTEGNGGVNDYTRIIADRAFRLGAPGFPSGHAGLLGQPPVKRKHHLRTSASVPQWRRS